MPRKNTKTAAAQARRRERMREALEYRKQGHNYRDIAGAMRISVSTAHTYVENALREITREPAEQVLALHLDRYDQLLAAYYEKALEGDYFAFDRVLSVMARIERLHGVESPREADQTTETHNALTQLLEKAKAQHEQ